MRDDPKLTIKNGVVYAYGLRLLKDPETEVIDRAERIRKSLEKIKEYGRRSDATPEERRAQFKLIDGDRK